LQRRPITVVAPLLVGAMLASAAVEAAADARERDGVDGEGSFSAGDIARITDTDNAAAERAYQDLTKDLPPATVMARLARALDGTQYPRRQRALIDRIRGSRLNAAPAVPALVRSLRSPDKEVRHAGVAALYEIGPAAGPAAVAPLIATLQDPDADIRVTAANALGGLGSWTYEDHPDHGEGARAAQAAQQPLAALIRDARQPRNVRFAAAMSLSQMLVDARVVPALIIALGDADVEVRVYVCQALERAKARPAVPALEARLFDRASKVQVAAAGALLAIGAPKRAVGRLAHVLNAPGVTMEDKAQAAFLLREYNKVARPALAALVRTALMPQEYLFGPEKTDGREHVREWAEQAIDRVGAPAVPFILPFVRRRPRKDDDVAEELHGKAIELVCDLGRAASSAYAALVPFLKSDDVNTRATVARCLVDLGVSPRLVAPRVLPLLSDPESAVVRDLVAAAKQLGPAAAPALPRLLQLARDKDDSIRIGAIDTLGNIGPPARRAQPELEASLADAKAEVRVAAALALVKIRIDPAARLRLLLDLLASRDAQAKATKASEAAAWRLGELASYPEGKEVLRALVAAFDTAPPEIHGGLAHAVAAFGPAAADSALAPLTRDIERGFNKEAVAALVAFGPKVLPAVPALVQALSGGNGSVSASAALIATARRSKKISTAVTAECAKTSGRSRYLCGVVMKEIAAPLPSYE
jgi:HEAT repeat protein